MGNAKPGKSKMIKAKRTAKGKSAALAIEEVDINKHCTGYRWTVADIDLLAGIIAIIAMGQAVHAAQIITELVPAEPAINDKALKTDAKHLLSIKGDTEKKRQVSRYHRDGLIFEAISWAAAQQATNGEALLRDPHIKSTTQGLDGLMIELDKKNTTISRATIFEDKCSEHPRKKFRHEIMPAFHIYHKNSRSSELVAAAATLIEKAGLNGTNAIKAAARVLDKKFRAYRGSLAITPKNDSRRHRLRIFKGYEELDGISQSQRTGAVLITTADLRAWFDALAQRSIDYIDNL